mmetsp:Transcript_98569/g.274348  ORF Transcript_98569/g.274348 Transcript_98569/m.274348 type:complete len:343 (-) Transcript_98569:593-1621(-)
MDVTPSPVVTVVGDLDTVWMKVTKLSLLTGPTDGFGDFFGLNTHDEVSFSASCLGASAQAPTREYAACDQRTSIVSLSCNVSGLEESDGIHLQLREIDDFVDEVKAELLDTEALLGMPVGSKTRLRFYLNNEQNVFDSALLGLTDIGFFEFCRSDVLSLVPGGQLASGAVRAAKAAKLSAKAVKRIAKVARRLRSWQRRVERIQRRYEAVQEKIESAQTALIMASEMEDLDSPSFDPVEVPSWPSLDSVLSAFDIIPCVDFAQGAIYRYTGAEITVGGDPTMGEERHISGAADNGGDATCAAASGRSLGGDPLPGPTAGAARGVPHVAQLALIVAGVVASVV